METNTQIACSSCSKPLPATGFFCGGCLTQLKCKSCSSLLEADNIGCTNCGTAKDVKAETNKTTQNVNTFRLHETLNDRTIEATFSDVVGKDLAGILRDTSANRQKPLALNGMLKQDQESQQVTEAEIINNDSNEEIKETVTKQPVSAKTPEYPILKAVAMKNLPSNETEWIVVYAFYASKFGEDMFSRQAIIDKYVESNRKNRERIKSLTAYITVAVKGRYINPLENGFAILDKGVEKAKEIIARTSGSAPKSKKSQKTKSEDAKEDTGKNTKKASGASKNLKRITSLNFEPAGKVSLKDFLNKYSPKSDNERNLLFIHYLQTVLEVKEITFNHLYSCYDVLELRISENLSQTTRNTASRTGWIETHNSLLSTTVKGNNQIKAWSKKN